MSFSKWFRKYERKILILITVVIAVSFGASGMLRVLGGVFSHFSGRGGSARARETGSILDRPIDQRDFIPFQLRWARFPFAGKRGEGVKMEDVWSAYAAVHLAEKLGIRVSDDEVRAFVLRTPAFFEDPSNPKGRYSHKRFLALLNACRMSQPDFERTLREFLAVRKLEGLLLGSAVVTSSEVWPGYRERNMSYRAAAVSFPVEALLAEVPEPGDEEVAAFYDTEKETWYREPEKIRVEVLAAPYERFAGEVTVTDEEARAYYDTHEQEFLAPARSEDDQETGGQADRQPQPFEEVRDEIVKRLRDGRARTRAETALAEARAKLEGDPEATPAALAEAQEGKLLLSTTDFFAAEEVTDVPVLGSSFGPGSGFVSSLFALKEGAQALSEVGQGTEAAVLCRLLGREPSRVLPLEEVRERVVDDLKRSLAARKAREQADQLAGELKEKGLSLTSEEVGGRGLTVEISPWFKLYAPDAPPYARQLQGGKPGDVLVAETGDGAFVVEVLEARPPAWKEFEAERQREKSFADMVNLRYVLPARWDAIVRREVALEVPVPKATEEPTAEQATTGPSEATPAGEPEGVVGGTEPATEPPPGEPSPGAP